MKDEPTVFVVDKHRPTRDAIRKLAQLMNLPCETYASGQDFMDAYSPSRPGCLILEIRIPGINGLAIQQRLAADGAALPVVFLTDKATVSMAVHAMRAGALHFLEKPFREHELWETIHEAILLDRERRRALEERQVLTERAARLTEKERRVLEMIAEGKSVKAIAAELGVSSRTVGCRRKGLMKKLEASSAVELAHYALMVCNGSSYSSLELQEL